MPVHLGDGKVRRGYGFDCILTVLKTCYADDVGVVENFINELTALLVVN